MAPTIIEIDGPNQPTSLTSWQTAAAPVGLTMQEKMRVLRDCSSSQPRRARLPRDICHDRARQRPDLLSIVGQDLSNAVGLSLSSACIPFA